MTLEVVKDTNFDESIWIRVQGERGAKSFFIGNVYMPPESKSTVTEIQRKFGEVAVDVERQQSKENYCSIGKRF